MTEERNHPESSSMEEDDERKVFCSRVPSAFDEEILKRILEECFGNDSVGSVKLVYNKDNNQDDENNNDDTPKNNDNQDDKQEQEQHKGFAFVVFDTVENRNKAIEKGTVRGGIKPNSKKKHTVYIRPIVREEDTNDGVCFLWKNFRCPYGDKCKFSHVGDGGCKQIPPSSSTENKKKQKCFAFKKKGKCKNGDSCPFLHESASQHKKPSNKENDKTCVEASKDDKKNNKDCINWKTKGKCRKKDKCPYRHDEAVREAFLKKKSKKTKPTATHQDSEGGKTRQPLSVRVFGLNYDTTEDDVRDYFKDCGPIVEITFPTFEDSGRSKGYCGVLFQSPKAVAKAVEKDGMELHERWLSVQAGKMYLRQWEQRDNERAEKSKREKEGDDNKPSVGEYGQKVKRRKTHGYSKD